MEGLLSTGPTPSSFDSVSTKFTIAEKKLETELTKPLLAVLSFVVKVRFSCVWFL